jgi:hypothetical protein
MKVLLYFEARNSPEDSSVYVVPIANVPKAVKKVLKAQPDHFDICFDEDKWVELAEAVKTSTEDTDKLAWCCDEFFRWLEIEGVTSVHLLSKPTITKYIVKQYTPPGH